MSTSRKWWRTIRRRALVLRDTAAPLRTAARACTLHRSTRVALVIFVSITLLVISAAAAALERLAAPRSATAWMAPVATELLTEPAQSVPPHFAHGRPELFHKLGHDVLFLRVSVCAPKSHMPLPGPPDGCARRKTSERRKHDKHSDSRCVHCGARSGTQLPCPSLA